MCLYKNSDSVANSEISVQSTVYLQRPQKTKCKDNDEADEQVLNPRT